MTPVLEAIGLTKAFGGLIAVDNVSLTVRAGEIFALIGPNGAGKSTCFNMLMGQLQPTRGSICLNGEDITKLAPRQIWAKGVGRTFQITATYPSMTVVENVQTALIAHYQRLLAILPYAHYLYRNEAMVLLDMVGLGEQADRHCAVLAYGDLKRLELAIALAHDPKILLMDEPTAGMSPAERFDLMQLTADIVASKGVSVLFTEHDMDVVFSHAQHLMVLNRGQIIAEGSVAAIRQNPLVQEVYLGGGTDVAIGS